MKNLGKSFIILVWSLLTVQAFGQAQFYQKIAGTYLDARTGEIVHMLWVAKKERLVMLYQANETQLPHQKKLMIQRAIDARKRFLKVQFYKSQYVCEFTFSADFQSFRCKNPDNSQQLFKRNDLPSRTSFADFLAQFPTIYPTGTVVNIPPVPAKSKIMPPEIALKFLLTQDQELREFSNRANYTFYSTTHAQQLSDSRLVLNGLRERDQHSAQIASFRYIARLQIRDDCYSVLFGVKSITNHDIKTDRTYLANFSKTGQLMGLEVVGSLVQDDYTHTTYKGWIDQETIKVRVSSAYKVEHLNNTGIKAPGKTYQEVSEIEYFVDEGGKLEQMNRFFEDIAGRYIPEENSPMASGIHYIKKESDKRYSLQVIAFSQGSFAVAHFTSVRYEKPGEDDSWDGRLWLKSQENGSLLGLEFSANNTKLKVIQKNGMDITWYR
ncbi:MAG TPA: hypothetical protein DCS93_13405 [Microscillaceae bacterium]|nr:hypothetical protein [Microscillaceae bacterium]